MRFALLCLILISILQANCQISLSGVVNSYYEVTALNTPNATLTVSSVSGINVGDILLMIQMKGASIDQSSSSSYGDVNSYNGAGSFELVEVCEIIGNDVVLTGRLVNSYSGSGAIQLISFPDLNSISIDGKIEAQEWNGATGGVVCMRAQNSITLNDSIDVSHQGFRGGDHLVSPFDCNFLFTLDAYEYEASTGYGAMKGEGIANYTMNNGGRGPLANGGGGGNDHNSGGGGGSNVGSGGMGGINDEPSTFNCQGDFPGEGGKSLSSGGDKIFLGGGGGAGHCNSTFNNKAGDGGGMVILMANEIIGNNQSILANGEDGLRGFGDGGSGGGAGGSVLLFADNFSSTLYIQAIGGNGGNGNGSYLDDLGNVFNTASFRCFGPGGGGSGGFVWFKGGTTPAGVNIAYPGGASGLVSNTQETGCDGLSNGASSGESGVTDHNAIVPTSNKINTACTANPQLNLGNDTLICYSQNLTLTAQLSGTYEWSTGESTQSITVTDAGTYWIKVNINGWFICDTIVVTNSGVNVDLGPDQTICGDQTITLDAGSGGTTYIWSTGETTQSIDVSTGGVYSVIADDGFCFNSGEITITECVENLFIPNTITPNGDGENDTWIIDGLNNYPGNHVTIMNRNGMKVYESTDYNNDWDGSQLPASTYFFILDLNDGISQFHGTITLIRQP